MSILFLIGFIIAVRGNMSTESFTTDVFIVWALFSIADALWIRLFKK